MTEQQLQQARRLYATGLSLRRVAAQLHAQTTYKSEASCAEGLYGMFKTRGWPLRPQGAVTAARNHRHGRKPRGQTNGQQNSYRRWLAHERGWTAIQGPGRPTCKATTKRGKPCRHHALEDSEFCFGHDPARAADRQAAFARTPERAYREPTLPAGPFLEWLHELHAELGSWRRVAEHTGLSLSHAYHYGATRQRRVAERVVRRCTEHAGVTLQAVYADAGREAIAA